MWDETHALCRYYGKIQDKDDDYYMQFNLVICGLDSVEARRWINATLVNLVENGVERSVILEQQHQGLSSCHFNLAYTMSIERTAGNCTVESRLYSESMSGATAKSNPTANKLDEKELARLQRQDHWIIVSRLKLIMDLIFVCECPLRLLFLRSEC